MSTFVTIKNRTRAGAGGPTILWSLVMAVTLCVWESATQHHGIAVKVGVSASVLYGAFLGWTRRAGAVFFAPILSWLVAWFPLWITAIIRHGFLKGVVIGFVLVTLGWLIIGALEFAVVGFAAVLFRLARGRERDAEIIIIYPTER